MQHNVQYVQLYNVFRLYWFVIYFHMWFSWSAFPCKELFLCSLTNYFDLIQCCSQAHCTRTCIEENTYRAAFRPSLRFRNFCPRNFPQMLINTAKFAVKQRRIQPPARLLRRIVSLKTWTHERFPCLSSLSLECSYRLPVFRRTLRYYSQSGLGPPPFLAQRTSSSLVSDICNRIVKMHKHSWPIPILSSKFHHFHHLCRILDQIGAIKFIITI